MGEKLGIQNISKGGINIMFTFQKVFRFAMLSVMVASLNTGVFATTHTNARVTAVCVDPSQNQLWFNTDLQGTTRIYKTASNFGTDVRFFDRYLQLLLTAKTQGIHIWYDDGDNNTAIVLFDQ